MRENLKVARKSKGMTQQQVADYLDKNRIQFKMRYENNLIVCYDGSIWRKGNNGLYYLKSKELTPSQRYLSVTIPSGNGVKRLLTHRVVAETFLENKEKLPVVNHIDSNTANNAVGNLEWCSQKHNINHMINAHKERYRTNMKQRRLNNNATTNKIAKEIGIMLGDYRDIENAVRKPTEYEKDKIENYFKESMKLLLEDVKG